MGKLMLLGAGAVGYVLGARAGRGRYDQIATQAQKVWQDPRVQQRKDQAASTVKDTVADAAQQAGDLARDKVASVTSSESVDTQTSSTPSPFAGAPLTGETAPSSAPPSGAVGGAASGPVLDPAAEPRPEGDDFPVDPNQPGQPDGADRAGRHV